MRSHPPVAKASAPHTARVVTMAGTTLRMSTPARAPIAKAASVHAAKATPRCSNNPGLSGLNVVRDRDWLPEAKYGW